MLSLNSFLGSLTSCSQNFHVNDNGFIRLNTFLQGRWTNGEIP